MQIQSMSSHQKYQAQSTEVLIPLYNHFFLFNSFLNTSVILGTDRKGGQVSVVILDSSVFPWTFFFGGGEGLRKYWTSIFGKELGVESIAGRQQ